MRPLLPSLRATSSLAKPRARTSPMPVPSASQLRPGTPVAIIQKADQRSGAQVTGRVLALLTRSGDHPRGIKVRLVDGRVGRVQRVLLPEDAAAAAAALDGEDGDAAGQDAAVAARTAQSSTAIAAAGAGAGAGARIKYRDVRADGHDAPDAPPQYDLGAYIKPARGSRQNKKRRGGADAAVAAGGGGDGGGGNVESRQLGAVNTVEQALAVCPVCDAFQGDEAAVAHHVEAHFATT